MRSVSPEDIDLTERKAIYISGIDQPIDSRPDREVKYVIDNNAISIAFTGRIAQKDLSAVHVLLSNLSPTASLTARIDVYNNDRLLVYIPIPPTLPRTDLLNTVRTELSKAYLKTTSSLVMPGRYDISLSLTHHEDKADGVPWPSVDIGTPWESAPDLVHNRRDLLEDVKYHALLESSTLH